MLNDKVSVFVVLFAAQIGEYELQQFRADRLAAIAFELRIDLKTATSLGAGIPSSLLVLVDDRMRGQKSPLSRRWLKVSR